MLVLGNVSINFIFFKVFFLNVMYKLILASMLGHLNYVVLKKGKRNNMISK